MKKIAKLKNCSPKKCVKCGKTTRACKLNEVGLCKDCR
jgi:hypothetical protein